MTKRLLLITYFFPPYNPTESRRSFIIARAALNDGWHVDVVAPWAPNYHSDGEFPDWSRHLDAENRVRIHRTSAGLSDSYPLISKLFDLFLRRVKGGWVLRRLTRFPDRCVSWLYFLVPLALWLAHKKRPDVVLTSSYPYTAHVAGLIVSTLFHLPWIADMRDGWAVDDSEQFLQIEPSVTLQRWHRLFMSVVVKRATQVWSVTPHIRDATAKFFGNHDPDKFVAVVPGYDLSPNCEYDKTERPKIKVKHEPEFVLGYTGSFRPNLTPAEPIIRALHILRELRPNIYSRLKLCVWGYTSRKRYHRYLLELLSRYQVEDRLDHRDSLPENELVSVLKDCDGLLLTNGSSEWTQKRLTTKLFVYLSAERPILAICEPGSAIAKLVNEANLGLTIRPSDSMAIAKALEDWLQVRDRTGELSFQPNLQALERYTLQKGVMPLIAKKLGEASGFAKQIDSYPASIF